MLHLRLDWQRCPDGVELVDVEDGGGRYRSRTDRREDFVLMVENLENPVVVQFVNTPRPDGSRFFDRFGMLIKEPTPAWSYANAKDVVTALFSINVPDELLRSKQINEDIEQTRLAPKLILRDGKPRLFLEPVSLYAFMLMEIGLAAEVGAKATRCEQCNKAYLTGPMTGRRSHAVYCSDRCRVAAMRKRNARAE